MDIANFSCEFELPIAEGAHGEKKSYADCQVVREGVVSREGGSGK